MIRLIPLFSGSKGNCTLIQTAQSNILLDCGYGFRATVARLSENNVAPQDISAIVITHEHSDHIAAVPYFARRYHTKIFAPEACVPYVWQASYSSNITEVTGDFELFDAKVAVYRCSHDSRECLGYRFTVRDGAVASVTDTGVATNELTGFLAPCKTVMLESNHDLDMLQNGAYPIYLKKRIASQYGHLSNTQAAEVLKTLVGNSEIKNVVLAHLSLQNNTKQLALKETADMYESCGVAVGEKVNLYAADQFRNEVIL